MSKAALVSLLPVSPLLLLILLPRPAQAAAKKSGGSGHSRPSGVSEAAISGAVNAFVDGLNTLDDKAVLAALAPADRATLGDKTNVIGLVYPRKAMNPTVKSWEKISDAGKVVGARAVVDLEEVDPIDGTHVPKERNWVFVLDPGNVLRISLASLWLDASRVGDMK